MVDIDEVVAEAANVPTFVRDHQLVKDLLAAIEQSMERVAELEGAVKKVRVCLKHLPDACPDDCAACVFDEVLGVKDGGNYIDALAPKDK